MGRLGRDFVMKQGTQRRVGGEHCGKGTSKKNERVGEGGRWY